MYFMIFEAKTWSFKNTVQYSRVKMIGQKYSIKTFKNSIRLLLPFPNQK